MAKAGKRKRLKPGAKIIVKGDGCWEGAKSGEVVAIEGDQVRVRATEEFWVTKDMLEERDA